MCSLDARGEGPIHATLLRNGGEEMGKGSKRLAEIYGGLIAG